MKSIIFNQHQVNHALKNEEGMFREVCKKQPQGEMEKPYVIRDMGIGAFHYPFGKCPYQVGQKIFVKESFVDFRNNNSDIFYKSDFDLNHLVKTIDLKWKPAQHMKQEHSRITLKIKSVKVERLRDISEEDAIKEGFKAEHWLINTPDCYEYDGITAVEDFAGWWDETHKKPEEKWEANPFVFCFSYEVVR